MILWPVIVSRIPPSHEDELHVKSTKHAYDCYKAYRKRFVHTEVGYVDT